MEVGVDWASEVLSRLGLHTKSLPQARLDVIFTICPPKLASYETEIIFIEISYVQLT